MKPLKIYFAGSIRGGRHDQALYLRIIDYLKNYGEVLTEHVGDAQLSAFGEEVSNDNYIYERDMDWLKSAEIVVAEVTRPSLGVGYELGMAEVLHKKVLCLYRPTEGTRLSAMIGGNAFYTICEYTGFEEVKIKIDTYLKKEGVTQK